MRLSSRIKCIVLATLMAFGSVAFLPYGSASAIEPIPGTGEEKAKNFIYAAVLEICFKSVHEDKSENEVLKKNPKIGEYFKQNILLNADTPFIKDNWMGSIKCNDAIEALLGKDAKITEDMIEEGGILYGAYAKRALSSYSVECEYNIYNNDMSGLLTDINGSTTFKYFQSYSPASDGDEKYNYDPKHMINRTDLKNALRFNYDDDGNFKSLSFPNISMSYTFDDYDNVSRIVQYSLDYGKAHAAELGSGSTTFCTEMMHEANNTPYGDPYPEDRLGLFLAPVTAGIGYMVTGFSLGEHNLGIVANTIKDIRIQSPDNTLERLDGAANRIALNVREIYFGGETPINYLDNHSDIAYVLYGRYLYNGDGNFPKGCGGISIKNSDPRLGELNNSSPYFWSTQLPYVFDTEAYEKTNLAVKDGFRTKVGASDPKTEGEDKSLVVVVGSGSSLKCSVIAERFNSITLEGTSSPEAKTVVFDYINPISIDLILGPSSEPPAEDPPAEDPPAEDPPTGTPIEQDDERNCYTNAGSLGWILCPMIINIQDAILGTYARFIIPALEVDTDLYHAGNEENDGTYQAWNIFRNIANYLFIILFIYTIFSQITGFNIDKNGVIKALPKLLIVAILINLSFLICQIAIDLGNIVGRGVGGLFNGITNAITVPDSIVIEGNEVSNMAWSSFMSSGWNTALVIIVAVLGAAVYLSQGLAFIIPTLLAFIGIIISVITLVAILGIRQAAIVLLVAASPIAFICYALPNTKSIFKKWFDAFKALLLAFPICSALVY
ncbi:hypothetical protein IJM16_00505, partial [Candidatus Saccharibacteria bacterium]|nr:hypothetical protein [Candidatus Saccharibacteria bacterium]